MKLTLLTGIIIAFTFSLGMSFAFQCPTDIKKIDEALAGKPSITMAQKAKVVQLRNKGQQLHLAGKHQESVDVLGRAKQILGIK